VRSLWRDRRVRGTVVLIALLGLYFAVPVEHQSSTVRLVTSLVVALICLVIAGSVFYREFRRMLRGEELSLTGLQLLMVLEAVLLMFALGYYSLAIHQPHEMVGIATRVDALYFSVTTVSTVGYGDVHAAGQFARVVTTVQLVFDVVFIAAFARLLKANADIRLPRDDPPSQ
jgi:voltage-gated potassium channel